MGAVDRGVPVYPIGIVQKLTDLSGRQIRYYEQQELLSPERTKGNQRLYSPIDVERLLRIKQLLAEGLTLEGVRQQLDAPTPAVLTNNPVEVPVNQPEDESRAAQIHAGAQITSLYPVRNQAALVQLLEARRAARERSDKTNE
jgi:MerR family glutamine synthetase transcriptional repressor